jgi:[ribosomal protein S18]-alanine N-acetyltransferase
MRVRPGTPEDIPSMIVLERQSTPAAHWSVDSYRQAFEQGIAVRIVLVADDEGSIRGFLIARIAREECELENIVVASSRQRCGIGSKLMQELVAVARAQGATRVFLEVRESNVAARRLYERCGFIISGHRKSYFADPGEDAVLYTLTLE